MIDIDINDYDYGLPAERIAQYPVNDRDKSQLLIAAGDKISKDIFSNITDYIQAGSLLVFNNTRVIRARLLFRKSSGALIEILCLEPLFPSDYELSLKSKNPVEWKCIIGNLKKWKGGVICSTFSYSGQKFELAAEKLESKGEAIRIRFTWTNSELSFGAVIEAAGHIPLPPYITREDTVEDTTRYQTVYSSVDGSVAAPTAGLHFTDNTFAQLHKKGIPFAELTLHVGAGTFQPVKSRYISDHEMHREHFIVTDETIAKLIANQSRIIAVGTTSVRTLESLYWLGVKLIHEPHLSSDDLHLGQWDAYNDHKRVSVKESFESLVEWMKVNKLAEIKASTGIIIIPGYKFMVIRGIITNFHQPRSTLLLLVSAWAGEKWKDIYDYALSNGFRFLSYGDCSLLL
jgi:S-adenosylmethionine:tRNA ribosyltransferase-isomerase